MTLKVRIEVKMRSSQVCVWKETRSCSDPRFEVCVCPWTRGSRCSWNTTFALKWGPRLPLDARFAFYLKHDLRVEVRSASEDLSLMIFKQTTYMIFDF